MFGLTLHTNFKDIWRESPKLVALSAFLSTAATQVPEPYQKYVIIAGVISGALGILLKKDDDAQPDSH